MANIVVLPRDKTGFTDAAKNISQMMNDIYTRRRQSFQDILTAVQQGLIDPNEALVRGTPGGDLYKRFLGAEPPRAPEEYVIPGQTAEKPVSPDEAATFDARSATPETMQVTPDRYEMRGGFQPRTVDQLKQYLIRQRMLGKEVDPQLEQYAGFTPKNFASILATNPDIAMAYQKVKNDPRMFSAYQRRLDTLTRENPLADPTVIQRQALSDVQSFSTGKPGEGAPSRAELGSSKGSMIYDIKNRDLAQKGEYWSRRLDQKDQELSLSEKRNLSHDFVQLTTRLAPLVGTDLAAQMASHYIKNGNLDDLPVEDELKKRVQDEFTRKDRVLDIKEMAARARKETASFGAERIALQRERLTAQVEQWNRMYEYYINNLGERSQRDITNQRWRVIAERMKDPRTRASAEEEALRFADHLGMEIRDPEGAQAIWEWIGQTFLNTPGWGTRTIGPPKEAPASAPFNPPRTVPKPLSPAPAAPSSGTGTPKTAKELIDLYRSGK